MREASPRDPLIRRLASRRIALERVDRGSLVSYPVCRGRSGDDRRGAGDDVPVAGTSTVRGSDARHGAGDATRRRVTRPSARSTADRGGRDPVAGLIHRPDREGIACLELTRSRVQDQTVPATPVRPSACYGGGPEGERGKGRPVPENEDRVGVSGGDSRGGYEGSRSVSSIPSCAISSRSTAVSMGST
jgi:hypothetical protein